MSEKAFTVRYLCNGCNEEVPANKVILGEGGEYCSKACQDKHEKELEDAHSERCICTCHDSLEEDKDCECYLDDD